MNSKLKLLPTFPLPPGFRSADDYLHMIAMRWADENHVEASAYDRITFELDAIKRTESANYFLIVADYVNYLRDNFIAGPGRGSSAGCLINYILGITDVNPFDFGLLFERFLNSEKKGVMSDIDTDTSTDGYQKILGYLIDKYGSEHVEIVNEYTSGYVLCGEKISDIVDTTTYVDSASGKNCCLIQSSAKEVERKGLTIFHILQYDILDTIGLIGEEKRVREIPLNEVNTLTMLSKGKIEYAFPGAYQKYISQIGERLTIDHLIAINALYRPGPLDYLPVYASHVASETKEQIECPKLQKYFADTYGLIVYQEQLMNLFHEVGDFTPGESDDFRKAVMKAQHEKIKRYMCRFAESGVSKGLDGDKLTAWFQKNMKYMRHIFNKSHSTCYTSLDFLMAYLKAHYPEKFKVALKLSLSKQNNYRDDYSLDSIHTDLTPCECWFYGRLNVVTARSNVGKTSFMLNAALQMFEHGVDSAYIFSLQMSAQQIAIRLLSICSGIETSRIKETESIDKINGLRTVIADLGNLDLSIDDTPAISIEEIENRIRERYDTNLTRVFFIDYLQLVTIKNGQFPSRYDELKYIFEKLAKLAWELNIVIVVLSQLGKFIDPESMITVHDLPDYYCETSVIDSTLVLVRPEMYNRNGNPDEMIIYDISNPEDSIDLTFDPASGKVEKS